MKIYLFQGIICLLLLGVLPSAAQDKAYPKEGDGIHSFLRRHDRAGDSYIKEFKELNAGKFTAKGGLIMGRKYIIPSLRQVTEQYSSTKDQQSLPEKDQQSSLGKDDQSPPKKDEQSLSEKDQQSSPGKDDQSPPKKDEPSSPEKDQQLPSSRTVSRGTDPAIFGKKSSEIKPQSNRLKNSCFYVISGHGGPDPGAISRVGTRILHEDEYAYDIALRLARNLMMEGATVHVIIQDPKDGIRDEMYLNNSSNETCMGKAIPRNHLDRLKQRVDKVNELYKQDKGKYDYIRAIDLHVDSRNKGKRIDVFFYHSDDKQSRKLATTMRDFFRKKYDTHQPGRGFEGFVEQRNLYILRHLEPPSILVETGNIQNDFDRRRLILSDNRQALANWMAQAFYEDYKKSVR